jgi:hypothetical protein
MTRLKLRPLMAIHQRATLQGVRSSALARTVYYLLDRLDARKSDATPN